MNKRVLGSTFAIGAACAVTGAAMFGLPTSSAATKAATTSAAAASTPATAPPTGMIGLPDGGGPGGGGPGGGHRGGGFGGGHGGGGIHSERVQADADGTGFVTLVNDTGTLSKIDGTTLTIKEGTATETFDTVSVTADGTVTVQRNGAAAKLASLKVGDHVRISKDGTTTRIDATTAAFEKAREAERAQFEQQRGAAMTWPSA